ncbi:undecaprenyl-diphosphate phosphatase [Lacrimispora sp. AGF001]|jgi:undecaprenyl-diphosphatase|uniref:undecaprenyl-diphosphate phosphatase n=1 Tax=Lacrimispora sp. AGF001 TaxID=3401631 RepID=UPI00142ADBD3|nr:undecaprenyl-diphosphate phosphatase [Paenibacillaceae bacterium]MBE5982232.1 undecaprenyl-diphosphate phosphatase [Paenibacillaceae bacterium]MBE5995163.1 undecaprenyl-diphosphate phosphatase [Paenibacillaceae bacterium]MTK07540.1 undecaprenyl-diphosphate phosphatase [Hungatella sp.]
MNIIEILKVIVLGIVEGFTEWLPISSTGHMILVDEIIHLNQPDSYKNMFLVVIQLGAILAVVVLYFDRLNPFSPRKKAAQKKATFILWSKIILACLPAAVIGILVDDILDKYLMNGYVVAATLIIYGVLFLVIENRNKYRNFEVQKVGEISYQTALYIGLFQLLSLIPGTSRSGSTILGAMILGCSRAASAEFSFFLGIPVMFGASLLKIVKFGFNFSGAQVFYLILGMVVAFAVSVYAIKFLMGYIRQHDFKFFGYYRIVLGAIVLLYFGVTAFLG